MELIKITSSTIDGASVQTVNARDLHAFLGANKDFSNWIKYQIATFGFDENHDYVVVAQNGEQCYQGVTLKKDYFLSLDMAKEVAMLSRCEEGKRVRQYFLECERKAKEAPRVMIDFTDPKVLLGVVHHLQEQVAAKDQIIEVQKEGLKKLDRIEASQGSLSFQEAAKTLGIAPLNRLPSILCGVNWIYKRAGSKNWLARQEKITAGYLEHAEHLYQNSHGDDCVSTRAKITPKGLVKIAAMLERKGH